MNQIVALVFTCAVALAATGNGLAALPETGAALDRQASDSSRAANILASFNRHRCLHAYDLTVSVAADSATLGGAVGSAAARVLAGQVALSSGGIARVQNLIYVDAGATTEQQLVSDRRAGLVVPAHDDKCTGTEVSAVVHLPDAPVATGLYGGADSAVIASYSKGQ